MVLAGLMMLSCHPGYILPGNTDTFCRSSLIHLSNTGHLIIFPFETSGLSLPLSLKTANIFNEQIHQINFFKKITLINDTAILSGMPSNELKMKKILYTASQRKADAVLLGSVEDYSVGMSSDTKVTVSAMIVDVHSGKKLWWGKKTTIGKPGGSYLLLGNRPTMNAPDVDKLLIHTVHEIVQQIFTD